MYKLSPIAALVVLTLSHTAVAEEGFRQHDAHVHGEVELNIAQDGQELLMEITAPGADVVGFEHAPQDDAQKKALADAVNTLNQANVIFSLSQAAGCHLEHASVSHTLGSDDHHDDHHDEHKHDDHHDHDHEEHKHDEHHDHDHDEHKHDEHHDHDHDEHKHDDHHDHGHDKHEAESGHGAFTVEYHYHCDNIAKLETIDTSWFKQFPTTEALKVNVLTDNKQDALRLQPNRTVISL